MELSLNSLCPPKEHVLIKNEIQIMFWKRNTETYSYTTQAVHPHLNSGPIILKPLSRWHPDLSLS